MNIQHDTKYTIRFDSDDILELLWNSGHEVPEHNGWKGKFEVERNGLVTFTYTAKKDRE